MKTAGKYTTNDFNFTQENTTSFNIEFSAEKKIPAAKGKTHTTSVDQDNYYLTFKDPKLTIAKAVVSGDYVEGVFGIYDHQVSSLRNTFWFLYDAEATERDVYLYVKNGNKLSAVTSRFRVTINQKSSVTLTRLAASTNSSYYDAGDNYNGTALITIYDQNGDTALLQCRPGDDCNTIVLQDQE